MEEAYRMFKVWTSNDVKMGATVEKTGKLGKKELHRSFRKTDSEKLKKYMKEPLDAYQSEMAEVLGCSESGMRFGGMG